MAYDGVVAAIPVGQAGMAPYENRLLGSATELLDAEGVKFEDRYIRKEAGAAVIDATGIGNVIIYENNPSDSKTLWIGALAAYTATAGATPAFVRAGGTSKTAGSPPNFLELTVPAGGHAAGNTVVVCVGLQNQNYATPVTISISDAAGNTYYQTVYQRQDAGIGNWSLFLWTSKLSYALTAGQKITVTLSSTAYYISSICAVSAEFSGIATAFPQRLASKANTVRGDENVSIGPPVPATLASLPTILVGATVCLQMSSETLTPLAGYSQAATAPSTSNSGDCCIDYKVIASDPQIICMHEWHSLTRIASGGTYKAATTIGSATVTGSGGTAWTTGAEAARIFPGDTITIQDANNIERRTVLSVQSDSALTTTEAWAATFAASDYVVQRGPRLITAATSGYVYKERGGDLDAVTLMSGTVARQARGGRFIVCGKEDGNLNRKLLYVNGYNQPMYLTDDGTSMTVLTTATGSNPDWGDGYQQAGGRPLAGVVHRDRVVLATPYGKDPHRLYFSSATNHTQFNTGASGGTTRRVRSDVGDAIFGLASFNGVLWVWKYPMGIFYIDDSDLDATNWVERSKSQAIGCAPSPYAVCPIDDDVLFMTPSGQFHLLSAVTEMGGVKASDLSGQLGLNPWLRQHVNTARLNQTISIWYSNGRTAMFAVPSAGSTVCDLTLKWDFGGVASGEPVKFSYSYRDTPDALALSRDDDWIWKPIIGEGGFVHKLERAERNKNGVAYTGRYRTSPTDFSHLDPSLANTRKLWDHLELVMEPVAASTLTATVYVDGTARQTLTFDASKRRDRKKLNVGDGYTISVEVANSVLNQNFKVLAHVVYFRPGNEDLSRPY